MEQLLLFFKISTKMFYSFIYDRIFRYNLHTEYLVMTIFIILYQINPLDVKKFHDHGNIDIFVTN